jgi:hypothetical protein
MVERAVTLNPNLSSAVYSHGWVALMCDKPLQSLESFRRLLRLSPLDPLRQGIWNGMSFAYFCLGRYEEGHEAAVTSLQFRKYAHNLVACIVNAVHAGHLTMANEAAKQLREAHPDFRIGHTDQYFPIRSAGTRDQFAAALRQAGMPE